MAEKVNKAGRIDIYLLPTGPGKTFRNQFISFFGFFLLVYSFRYIFFHLSFVLSFFQSGSEKVDTKNIASSDGFSRQNSEFVSLTQKKINSS